jgi:hypothetical protein
MQEKYKFNEMQAETGIVSAGWPNLEPSPFNGKKSYSITLLDFNKLRNPKKSSGRPSCPARNAIAFSS